MFKCLTLGKYLPKKKLPYHKNDYEHRKENKRTNKDWFRGTKPWNDYAKKKLKKRETDIEESNLERILS